MVQSTVCIWYYLLHILIGVCYNYLHPINENTEVYREGKTCGNCTGIKWQSWGPDPGLRPEHMLLIKDILLCYASMLRYLWKEKKNITHSSILTQPLLVPGVFLAPFLSAETFCTAKFVACYLWLSVSPFCFMGFTAIILMTCTIFLCWADAELNLVSSHWRSWENFWGPLLSPLQFSLAR